MSLSVHKSAEDYLEAILLIKQKRGCVRSIDIVNLLGFSKPSVSVAMKKLRENDYILMDSEGYITLTESGMNIAQKILEKYSMQDDFDLVCGSEFNGERGQKWEVIEYALEQFGISPDEAIMVGDRKYDVIGAKKCGVECIGVRFGYAELGELEREGAVYVAENADDLYKYLTK